MLNFVAIRFLQVLITVALIEDPRAIRLVERLLDGRILELKPEIDITSKLGYRYPYADSILETPSEETIKILRQLEDTGVLIKTFFDKLPKCPSCNSFEIRPGSYCTKCGSGNINKGSVIEHYADGYVGFEHEFHPKNEAGVSTQRLICPKCNQELKQLGVDYSKPGFFYKCNSCGHMSNEADIKWRCSDCGSIHTHREVEEVEVYSYKLNEANRRNMELEVVPKRRILEYLVNEGYEIQSAVKIAGKSGAKHEVDVYATKKKGLIEHKLIVGISSAENEVGQDDVLRLYAKRVDIEADDAILVAIPKLSSVARSFADHYDIKYVEAVQLKEAVDKLFDTAKFGTKGGM
jgi:hypothetical protein